MDAGLQAAWRAAQAAPGDAAARAAYGQALLRAGRRLAAALELRRARALGAAVDDRVVVRAPPARGEPAAAWEVDPALEAARAGGAVTAPLPDARLGLVRLRGPGGAAQAFALVPWPRCAACRGQPAECPRCDGRGEVVEFTGRAEERLPCDACDGTGRVACDACDGAPVVPARGATDPACAHEAAGEAEDGAPADAPDWTLRRCLGCGLALLRHEPSGDTFPACAACGRFACDGACGALEATT